MFDQEKYPQQLRLCILNTLVPDNKLKLRGEVTFLFLWGVKVSNRLDP